MPVYDILDLFMRTNSPGGVTVFVRDEVAMTHLEKHKR